MKVCKFCKYGYPLCDKDGLCVYCYLHFNSYPIKKDANDTCPSFESDDEGDLVDDRNENNYMRKIPTLFKRVFYDHSIIDIVPVITEGCEEAFKNGIATIKIDGACCAIIDGRFYKRYDAKKGKKPPEGAIPCCDPDPVTGHWPHWVEINENNPADKWFIQAKINYRKFAYSALCNGTYEAIGPHFNRNPYGLNEDLIIPHGCIPVKVNRDFESIKNWLNENKVEGLVFWLNGEPVCKIKRTDFGYEWPVKN